MNKVSFEEIGCVAATFYAKEGVEAGQAVMLTGNGEVGICGDGKALCGVALSAEAGVAGVQVRGFMTVRSAVALTVGPTALVGDGTGGVKALASGTAALVVDVDDGGKTAVICL